MNKKYSILTAALLFFCSSGFSQNNSGPDVQMLPGTGVGQGLPKIYSPNLFDGSVNINIPIYDYKGYGISLSYNTKGIKVDQPASSPGLNWQVSGLPSIVRIVKDIPDEAIFNEDSLLVTGTHPVVNSERHILGKLHAYAETQQDKSRPNTYRDKECDEFRVSLNGADFSFYLGSSNNVFLTTEKNYKVQLYYNGQLIVDTPGSNIPGPYPMAGEYGFNIKITDNEGNQYYFAPSYTVEDDISDFKDWEQVGRDEFNLVPEEWSIEKVVLSDGSQITYYHDLEGYFNNFPGYPFKQYVNHYIKEDNFNTTPSPSYYTDDQSYDYNNFSSIQRVSYPNGITADFLYDSADVSENGAKMLDEIDIAHGGNSIRYKLHREKDHGRWFLKKIMVSSGDSSLEQLYYSFGYSSIYLPDRLDLAKDLYGYYNGDSSSAPIGSFNIYYTDVPLHGSQAYGISRAYNAHFAQAGLLTQVINTYGGETDYYYGPNVVANPFPAGFLPANNDYIGINEPDGVRVDSIVEQNRIVPGSYKSTVFDYSGGQLFIPGGYFHYPVYIDSATNAWNQVLFQEDFLTSHELINGSNHGYSSVTISAYGLNAANQRQLLSKKVATFTNMKDATSNNLARYYKVPGSKDFFDYPYTNKQYLKSWEIGLPLTVTEYDQNNRIIRKAINNYRFSNVDLSASDHFANNRTITINSGRQQYFGGRTSLSNWYPYQKVFTDSYYPYKGHADLESTVTLKYISDSRYVADTLWYGYDDHDNLDSLVSRKSNGDKILTRKVFNYEIDGPDIVSGYPRPNALYDMTKAGLEKVISIERWKMNPATTVPPAFIRNNNELLSAVITNYEYDNGKLWTKGLWSTSIGQPVSYQKYTGVVPNGPYIDPYWRILDLYTNAGATDSNFVETSKVTLFDEHGNPLEAQSLDADKYKAMIWDTATNQKLADAANCRYSDMAYTSFEATLAESNLTVSENLPVSGGITGSHAQYLWTEMSPGAPVSITGTQNLSAGKQYLLSFWVYGALPAVHVGSQSVPLSSANLLHTRGSWHNYQVRFTPAVAGKIKITGTGALSEIDEIRLCPAGATLESRTYDPLFGQSSSTDGNGQILYTGFDKLGRMNMQRDVDGNILSEKVFKTAN
ncbi:MAG TPA: hypothetical protein VFL76_08730 [Edaphocola sp.]|nr:hypothetical protein [Edaphocola sp.]